MPPHYHCMKDKDDGERNERDLICDDIEECAEVVPPPLPEELDVPQVSDAPEEMGLPSVEFDHLDTVQELFQGGYAGVAGAEVSLVAPWSH